MLGLIADPSPLQSDVDCTGAQIDPQVRRLIILNQCRASLFGNNDFKFIRLRALLRVFVCRQHKNCALKA
jgi:hypothetical protein